MNVAFISNVVYPFVTGGAEKRIYEVGKRLAARGHEVTVYGRHFWDGPREITYDGMTLRAVAPGRDLYTGERRSITEAIDFSVRLVPTLREHLKDDEHDVLIASVFPYFPVLTSYITKIGTDTPLVTTWHEVWGEYWEEYLGVLSPFGKFIEHATARVAQYPIAVSGITANRLTDLTGSSRGVEVIPNGINFDQIRRAPLPEEGYDILFVGRLIEHKNVPVLMDAFDAVAGDFDITLGIVGDGPEANALKEKKRTLTHGDNVDFLGFLEEYEDVLGQMRAANVFVSPSTREGFGITFAEAMAAGCTVIAASHPDSAAEEVVDGAGFLVNPTVSEVSDSLERVLQGERPVSDPVARAQEFSWDSVADQVESFLDSVVNE